MDIRQRINRFNRENCPFYIVDHDSGRIEYGCEAGGFFCYSDSLPLLENFGVRFRAVCMDGEKFAQLVGTALKEAAEKEEQEAEREIQTIRDASRESCGEKPANGRGIMTSRPEDCGGPEAVPSQAMRV